MTNPAMPGLVKVGMTTKMPHLRAAEMSAHEGLPIRMALEYYALVSGSQRAIEASVHQKLKSVSAGKEWFRCDVHVAIAAIRECAASAVQHEKYLTEERPKAEALLATQAAKRAEEERERQTGLEKEQRREAAIKRLTDDFLRLLPHIAKIYGRAFFSTRLSSLPDTDLLLLVQYHQARYLLRMADRQPIKGWLDGWWNGDFPSIGTDVIEEYKRRVAAAKDKTPFNAVLYVDERKELGL